MAALVLARGETGAEKGPVMVMQTGECGAVAAAALPAVQGSIWDSRCGGVAAPEVGKSSGRAAVSGEAGTGDRGGGAAAAAAGEWASATGDAASGDCGLEALAATAAAHASGRGGDESRATGEASAVAGALPAGGEHVACCGLPGAGEAAGERDSGEADASADTISMVGGRGTAKGEAGSCPCCCSCCWSSAAASAAAAVPASPGAAASDASAAAEGGPLSASSPE